MPKYAIATGAALALCSAPAFADLSAEAIWADWQEVYAALGSSVSAESETYADGTLTLTGIQSTITMAGAESATTYGTITLVEQADGSVAIEIPATMDITTVTEAAFGTSSQTFTLETTGWQAVVREEGDGRAYTISADEMAYAFDDLTGEENGEPVSGRFSITGMETAYSSIPSGDELALDQTLTATGATLTAASPASGFDMTYTMQGLTADLAGTMDLSTPSEQPTLSSMGLLFSGDMTHAGSTLALNAPSETGPVSITGTSSGGKIAYDISEDTLGYTLSSVDANMAVQLAAFPVPVNLSMAELTTGFALPMGVSEEPKPFALTIAYRDVAVDDTLWGLFDPTGQLPRDPATILLDLSGTAQMNADIFGDPEAMAALAGPPGELKTMDLTQLRVALAGAELTGNGAVEFPTPGLIPQPVGKVNLSLTGGLALVDSLVALGFVPPEQAAFVKGMAGVVARPVGEDQLESEIEFTPGGGITANGLPLQ